MSQIRRLSDQLFFAKIQSKQVMATLLAKKLASTAPSSPEEAFEVSMAILFLIENEDIVPQLQATRICDVPEISIRGVSIFEIHELKRLAQVSYMTKFRRRDWRRFSKLIDQMISIEFARITYKRQRDHRPTLPKGLLL